MSLSTSKNTDLPPASKFIPNLKQLHQAISNLPDTSDYEDDTFTTTLLIGSKVQQLTFTKKTDSTRQSVSSSLDLRRKILIRNQDRESIS